MNLKFEYLKVGMKFRQIKEMKIYKPHIGTFTIKPQTTDKVFELIEITNVIKLKNESISFRLDLCSLNTYFELVKEDQSQDERTITKDDIPGYKPTKEELNIGKKAKIINHKYILNNTECKIKAVVKDYGHYVVTTDGFNTLYIKFENIEVIGPKEEWEVVSFSISDKSIGVSHVIIRKDTIHIINYDNFDWLSNDKTEYDMDLCKDDLENIKKAWKSGYQKEVRDFILSDIKVVLSDKDLNDILDEIKTLNDSKEQILNENTELGKQCDELFHQLERLVK